MVNDLEGAFSDWIKAIDSGIELPAEEIRKRCEFAVVYTRNAVLYLSQLLEPYLISEGCKGEGIGEEELTLLL